MITSVMLLWMEHYLFKATAWFNYHLSELWAKLLLFNGCYHCPDGICRMPTAMKSSMPCVIIFMALVAGLNQRLAQREKPRWNQILIKKWTSKIAIIRRACYAHFENSDWLENIQWPIRALLWAMCNIMFIGSGQVVLQHNDIWSRNCHWATVMEYNNVHHPLKKKTKYYLLSCCQIIVTTFSRL